MKRTSESASPPTSAKKAGAPEQESVGVPAGDMDPRGLLSGVDAILWEARSCGSGQDTEGFASTLSYTYVSPQAERFLGYSPRCWLADSGFWARCIHPGDRDYVLDCYKTGISGAKAFHVEYRALHQDGSVVFVRDVVGVELVGQGAERRLRGVLVEVGDWKRTEEALREAEERYRELVENINECVFSVDEQGRITYMSPVIETLSGYQPGEVLNRHFSGFVYPPDLEMLSESFARTLLGQPEPREYRLLKKCGDVQWVRSWTRVIVSGDRIMGVRGALVDIGDRKQAEAELRESQARYQQLFENANDMIYTFDLDGTLTSVNSAVEHVSGYLRSELIGMNLAQLTAPEAWEFARGMIQRKAAGGQTIYETVLLTKDGHRVPIEVNSRAIMRNGRPGEIQGIARDLTERRRTERLAAERNRLENEVRVAAALARAGRELMACRDAPALLERLCRVTTEVLECDCSHIFCCQANEDAYATIAGYGHPPEEEEALRLVRVPRGALLPLIERLERDDVTQVLLPDLRDPSAIPFPTRFGATVALFMLLRRGDDVLGIHAACYRGRQEAFSAEQREIARGVAQLASLALENARLLEELERVNRLKSDFMATMSHELRTPLNVIIGYNQMLLEQEIGALNSKQIETSRRIKDNAAELLDLVNSTLAVGRLETGVQPVALLVTDVGTLLRELEVEITELHPKAGVDFTWQRDTELPPVRTDPIKLKIVMKNLIANAVRFTAKGSICVAAHNCGDAVELAVSDTGVGIPEELQQAIFEPFYQIAGRQTHADAGVGLGLYIVQRLLDLIAGSVTVESKPGRGSTFRVRLSLNPGPHARGGG